MKFACSRCWDYDCHCTKEQLEEHEAQTKEEGIRRRLEESEIILNKYKEYLYTRTCYGDMKSLLEYLESNQKGLKCDLQAKI